MSHLRGYGAQKKVRTSSACSGADRMQGWIRPSFMVRIRVGLWLEEPG